MTRALGYFFVFFLALAWFSFFQPWGGFNDPDAFYHAKLASMIVEQGPLTNFPWLDLTILNEKFVDQHFLFHLLLIPFIKWRGMLPGAHLAAVIFAAGFVTVFYGLLRRLQISHPWVWIVLLAASGPLIVRLSLAKASPLALTWFFLGMGAIMLRRPLLGTIAGLGFVVSHGGWIILIMCQLLMIMGERIFERVVEGSKISNHKSQIPKSILMVFLFTLFGIFLGAILHPNAKNLFSFLWVQVVSVGISTPIGRVFLGEEWLPIEPLKFFFALFPLVIAACFVFWGWWFAHQSEFDRRRASQIIALSLPLAVLFAMTLKSYRFVEYLVPVIVLWLGSIWSLVDTKRLPKIIIGAVSFLLVSFLIYDGYGTWRLLHAKPRSFDQFRAPMAVISALAQPGDRVFHSNWDQFPQLFALDDRLRYVAGVDPTFLLAANPELSDLYRDLTIGRRTDAYPIIHDRFQARFVLVEPAGHEIFAKALEQDRRFRSLYHDERASVYAVQ